MALLRSYEDEDYECSHSTMLVTDSWEHVRGSHDPWADESPWLTPDGSEGGTFVVAGVGWMNITAPSDEYHRVRLEAHDSEPPLDLGGWGDVVETPYGSGTGWVGTGTLFGEEDDAQLDLGGPGRYRVRVSRRAAADSGDEFLFQFWPASADQPGPRHLARDPRPESAHWRRISDAVGADLRAHVWWTGLGAGRFSVSELSERTLLPAADVLAALRDEERAGRLVIDGEAEDFDAVLALRLAGGPSRFNTTPVGEAVDGDMDGDGDDDWDGDGDGDAGTFGAAWTDEDHLVLAVQDSLADWRLAEPDQVLAGEVHLEIPRLSGAGGVEGGSAYVVVPVPESAVPRPPQRDLPWGAPPVGGYVSALGQLVLWEAGVPVVRAELGEPRTGRRARHTVARQAFQTTAGTVVVTEEEALLVRPAGTVEVLVDSEVSEAAVDVAGSAAGIVQHHRGRHPWTALHWIDLISGERSSWRWSPTEDWMQLVGVLDGAMLLNHVLESGEPTVRWAPGSAPESLPWHVASLDPWTGALTRWRGEDGTVLREETSTQGLLLRTGGLDQALPPGAPARLSPGGRMLFEVSDGNRREPSLTVLDLGAEEPRVVPLPSSVDVHNLHGCTYVWENPHLLLMGVHSGRQHLGCAAIRVDAVEGSIQRVDLGQWADQWGGVVLVRPVIR